MNKSQEAEALRGLTGTVHYWARRFRRSGEYDDLCQEAWAAAVCAVRIWDPDRGTLNSLATALIVRRLVDVTKARRKQASEVQDERALAQAEDTGAQEHFARLTEGLDQMTKIQRRTVVSLLHGQSSKEIGERERVSRKAVMKRVGTALIRIKERKVTCQK